MAPHGHARVAGNCGGAAAGLMAERTIAVRAGAAADQGCPTDTDARRDTMFVMTDSTSANVRRSVDQPLPARDEFGPLPRGIHHLCMTVPDIDAATTFSACCPRRASLLRRRDGPRHAARRRRTGAHPGLAAGLENPPPAHGAHRHRPGAGAVRDRGACPSTRGRAERLRPEPPGRVRRRRGRCRASHGGCGRPDAERGARQFALRRHARQRRRVCPARRGAR